MSRILKKIVQWLNPARQQDDLTEEMQLHVELRAQRLREAGLSDNAAIAEASKRFGNKLRLQEECRSAWGVRWLDELRQDLSHSVRLLHRDWIASTAAILTLALGIGATGAAFAFVEELILRPLPISRPETLVTLFMKGQKDDSNVSAFCYPAFVAVSQRARSLETIHLE
jgi:hypothetical protein